MKSIAGAIAAVLFSGTALAQGPEDGYTSGAVTASLPIAVPADYFAVAALSTLKAKAPLPRRN